MKIQFTDAEIRQAICAYVRHKGIGAEVDPSTISFTVTRNPSAIVAELEVGLLPTQVAVGVAEAVTPKPDVNRSTNASANEVVEAPAKKARMLEAVPEEVVDTPEDLEVDEVVEAPEEEVTGSLFGSRS